MDKLKQLSPSSTPLLLVEVLVLVSALWFPRGVQGNEHAKDLYKELLYNPLRNYNKEIRPVQNGSETMIVKAGLRLSQVVDLVSCPQMFQASLIKD